MLTHTTLRLLLHANVRRTATPYRLQPHCS